MFLLGRTIRTLLTTILFILISTALPHPLVLAVPLQEIEKKKEDSSSIREILDSMKGSTLDEIWLYERLLEDFGPSAAVEVKKEIESQSEVVQLACGKMLCSVGKSKMGLELLFKILKNSRNPKFRLCAGDLIFSFAPPIDDRQEMAHWIEEKSTEVLEILGQIKDVDLEIRLLKILWIIGPSEEEKAKSYESLKSILDSEIWDNQLSAAFALSEIRGSIPLDTKVKGILEKIVHEPTPNGLRATLLLQLNRLIGHTVRSSAYRGKLSDQLLEELRSKIQEFYVDERKTSDQLLIESASRGMVGALDRFSSYMNKMEWKAFKEDLSGSYAGIGASVVKEKKDLTIQRVFYNGPAYKSGILSRDKLIKINKQDISGKTLMDVVKLLRGKPESEISITVKRRGVEKELTFTIVRKVIHLSSVKYRILPGQIGYIKLNSFGDDSPDEFERGLQDLQDNHKMKGLIFDLRGNPGGLLLAAQKIGSKFLEGDKLIVYSEGRNHEIAPKREFRTLKGERTYLLPLVILVNEHSASAAEIVAGALQDHKRGILVGKKTFGKGSVQQLIPLEVTKGSSALRLTIAKYFLPTKRSIHEIGIDPDIVISRSRYKSKDLQLLNSYDKGVFEDYVIKYFSANKALFEDLAEDDQRDWSKYPNFEEWYKNLVPSKASRDTIRLKLRRVVRNYIADERGRGFIIDIVEDIQLQEAIKELAKRMNINLTEFDYYQGFSN